VLSQGNEVPQAGPGLRREPGEPYRRSANSKQIWRGRRDASASRSNKKSRRERTKAAECKQALPETPARPAVAFGEHTALSFGA
jgi:hypothetical protein